MAATFSISNDAEYGCFSADMITNNQLLLIADTRMTDHTLC